MKLRNEIGVLFADQQFEALYSQRGQPAETPWRLALVTLMQFMENLTDREAADEEYGDVDPVPVADAVSDDTLLRCKMDDEIWKW